MRSLQFSAAVPDYDLYQWDVCQYTYDPHPCGRTCVEPNMVIQDDQIKPFHPRIVDGKQATPHSFPWIVNIEKRCGGSIIGKNWVDFIRESFIFTFRFCLRRTASVRPWTR